MTANRAACTLGADKCAPRTLAEATHCVARHSTLPARELAARIGVGYDWFTKITDDSGPRAKAPAWLMLALAIHTGRTEHLRRQAADAGLVAYELPRGKSSGEMKLAQVMREVSEFAAKAAAALENGEIEANEDPELQREGHEAIESIAQFLAWSTLSVKAARPRPQAVGER
jgi:hypothetical protein